MATTNMVVYRRRPGTVPNSPLPNVVNIFPHDDGYAEVTYAANIAQRILALPRAIEVLTDLAMEYDRHADQANALFQGNRNLAQTRAREFSQKISEVFPVITIDETITNPNIYGQTLRGEVTVPFNPRNFTVTINGQRFDWLMNAKDKTFRNYLFALALTFVHEVGGHVFLNDLTGGRAPTPPAVVARGFPPSQMAGVPAGESGHWLESKLYGGGFTIAGDGSQELPQRETFYIVFDEDDVKPIKADVIDEFMIKRNFIFPIPVNDERKRVQDLPRVGPPNVPAPDPEQFEQGRPHVAIFMAIERCCGKDSIKGNNVRVSDLEKYPLDRNTKIQVT